MIRLLGLIALITFLSVPIMGEGHAQTNTVTSTVTGTNTVTVDKTPPTANAPVSYTHLTLPTKA